MFGKRSDIEALREELARARTRIVELEQERHEARVRDPLTGALTVAVFRDQAGRELARARRSGVALSLALVDIDGFRALNAARGATAADAAFRGVCERLGRITRASDLVGRTGADELAVLLPETDLDGARAWGARLVEALEVGELVGAGFVTVSVGVASQVRGDGIDQLLAAAAAGLDRARAAGGARVACVDDERAVGEQARRDAHEDVIEALASALLARDRYTGEHSESVVEMSKRVAVGLGLDAGEIERIGAAALLHDIGKVAIPDHILNKPAQLDDDEWVLMREHPVIGERILRAIPGMGAVARIVRHEHERYDGGGYPDGIKGEQIPIGSRIILACDTYHAMTSDRPYRSRMAHADAIRELVRCAGTQFDPRVTEALIGYLHHLHQAGLLEPDPVS